MASASTPITPHTMLASGLKDKEDMREAQGRRTNSSAQGLRPSCIAHLLKAPCASSGHLTFTLLESSEAVRPSTEAPPLSAAASAELLARQPLLAGPAARCLCRWNVSPRLDLSLIHI